KLAFFENKNSLLVFDYTAKDKSQLDFLEKTFSAPAMRTQINPYSLNKCLGAIYFLKQQNDKAIEFWKKAISVLPPGKSWQYFNSAEAYDAIVSIYFLKNDTVECVKTLLNKIDDKPGGKKRV